MTPAPMSANSSEKKMPPAAVKSRFVCMAYRLRHSVIPTVRAPAIRTMLVLYMLLMVPTKTDSHAVKRKRKMRLSGCWRRACSQQPSSNTRPSDRPKAVQNVHCGIRRLQQAASTDSHAGSRSTAICKVMHKVMHKRARVSGYSCCVHCEQGKEEDSSLSLGHRPECGPRGREPNTSTDALQRDA